MITYHPEVRPLCVLGCGSRASPGPNWGSTNMNMFVNSRGFTKKSRPRSVFPKNCPQKNRVYFAKNELAEFLCTSCGAWLLLDPRNLTLPRSSGTARAGGCHVCGLGVSTCLSSYENKHQDPPQVHWKLHPRNLTWPLRNDGWKMSFLLGLPIFRGYVKFPGCTWSWHFLASGSWCSSLHSWMQNPGWENNLRFIPKKRNEITEIRNIPMVVFLAQFKMYASKYVFPWNLSQRRVKTRKKWNWLNPQPRFSTGSSLEYATFHLALQCNQYSRPPPGWWMVGVPLGSIFSMSMITTKLTPGNTTTEQPSERNYHYNSTIWKKVRSFWRGDYQTTFWCCDIFHPYLRVGNASYNKNPAAASCQETNSWAAPQTSHTCRWVCLHVHFISCMSCSLLQPVTEPDAPSFSQKPCDCGRSAPQLCMHMFACSSTIIHTRYEHVSATMYMKNEKSAERHANNFKDNHES